MLKSDKVNVDSAFACKLDHCRCNVIQEVSLAKAIISAIVIFLNCFTCIFLIFLYLLALVGYDIVIANLVLYICWLSTI